MVNDKIRLLRKVRLRKLTIKVEHKKSAAIIHQVRCKLQVRCNHGQVALDYHAEVCGAFCTTSNLIRCELNKCGVFVDISVPLLQIPRDRVCLWRRIVALFYACLD